jgi:hypothetical protein
MRTVTAVVATAVLALGLAAASAQEVQDATIADPDVHHVVLENDHVRVLEVMAASGYKSPMHSHPPLVIMSCDSARIKMTPRDGEPQIFDLKPGSVVWLDGIEHSWELFVGNLHGFAVEVKGAKPKAAPAE